MKLDFIILVLLYVVPSFFLWKAILKALKSGSWYYDKSGHKVESDENVHLTDIGLFKFWVWGTLCYIVIFFMIAYESWEVWFS
jgi:hypothetical protein